MATFIIPANWIERITEGRNWNWNYDYKEYIFNENCTIAHGLKIPQNTHGIKAMSFKDGGIIGEFDVVVLLHDDGTEAIIFDIDDNLTKAPEPLNLEDKLVIVKRMKGLLNNFGNLELAMVGYDRSKSLSSLGEHYDSLYESLFKVIKAEAEQL